jgi:hypothetical protein
MSYNTIVRSRFGTLISAAEFKKFMRTAESFADEFPVLHAVIDPEELSHFKTQVDSRGVFGVFGLLTSDGMAMTLCIGYKGSQIHWLADARDAEAWSAIDTWKKAGRLAVSFSTSNDSHEECVFGSVSVAFSKELVDFRKSISAQDSSNIWKGICDIAMSGVLQNGAQDGGDSNCPRVFVNTLMTNHLTETMVEGLGLEL